MATITEANIRAALEFTWPIEIEPRAGKGFVVILPWGRKVNVFDTHIDLRGITKLLPGENEKDREQLQFELMFFEADVLGEVPLIGLTGWEDMKVYTYARVYDLPVDDNHYRTFSKAQARSRFGDNAEVGRSWFPIGWRISVPEVGKVVIFRNERGEKTIDKVVGPPEIYERALRLLNDLQGFVILRGSKSNIVAGMSKADALDIKAIPEWRRSWWSAVMISYLCANVFGPIGAMCGMATGNVVRGIGAGLLIGCVVACAIDLVRTGGGVRGERERGRALFASSASKSGRASRKASMDDLQKRGMLQ